MLAKPMGVLRLQLRSLRVRVPRTVVCLDGAVLLLENDPEGKGAPDGLASTQTRCTTRSTGLQRQNTLNASITITHLTSPCNVQCKA